MKRRAAQLLILAILTAGCSSGDAESEKAAESEKSAKPEKSAASLPSCSTVSLRTLLATDSTKLRRVERSASPGQSTEGGEIALFYEGRALRRIRATHFEETGRAREFYYLLDSLSFVRVRAEDHYVQPITSEHNPSIASTVVDTMWVCEGRAQATRDSAAVRDALATVRQLVKGARAMAPLGAWLGSLHLVEEAA